MSMESNATKTFKQKTVDVYCKAKCVLHAFLDLEPIKDILCNSVPPHQQNILKYENTLRKIKTDHLEEFAVVSDGVDDVTEVMRSLIFLLSILVV